MSLNSPSIFYDLETSDLSPVGQIMNFCFSLVDQDFNIQGALHGTIRLSRLQLPRAAAILANKIDVIEHQKTAELSEAQAMNKIHAFIKSVVEKYGDNNVALIGYNSARFDLDYLRTSLIRNGLNPYFKVRNRDLLFVSRKLSVSCRDFPRVASSESPEKLSLRLETLSKAFGLLEGKQVHESGDDVCLTIALARYYAKQYKIDVRDYLPYEPSALRQIGRGTIFERELPEYNLKSSACFEKSPYILLDSNHRYALWINLNRHRELMSRQEAPERAIEFFKVDGSDFFSNLSVVKDEKLLIEARKALDSLSNVSLQNYFKESDCDIEAQIYRLDQNSISLLSRCMWHGEKNTKPSGDARRILTRFKLANADESTVGLDAKLKEYAAYRYGGRMKVSRYSDAVFEEGVQQEGFHPTLSELFKEIEEIKNTGDAQAQSLMQSLEHYYKSSSIFRAL